MKKQASTYTDNEKGNQNQMPLLDAVYMMRKTGATNPIAKKTMALIYLLAAGLALCLTTIVFIINNDFIEYTTNPILLKNEMIAMMSVLFILLIISIISKLNKLVDIIKKRI